MATSHAAACLRVELLCFLGVRSWAGKMPTLRFVVSSPQTCYDPVVCLPSKDVRVLCPLFFL